MDYRKFQKISELRTLDSELIRRMEKWAKR
jgi:hypothetical protein